MTLFIEMKGKKRRKKGQIQQQKTSTIDTPTITTQSESKYFILSFVLPFIILGTAFALNKVYPFGDRQILIYDFWQQYYPFLSSFWHKLREGTLSPWSWTAGAEYLALYAYYLASPLNLLTILTPHPLLRETLTLIILIKIGLAGLFMAYYLRYNSGQSTITLPFFASFYALCAFALGYYYNIMWLDSFALLPLVILGLEALMREDKYRLYIASLALAILSNFYIGFFICIFVVISFLSRCYVLELNFRNIIQKLFKLAAFSFIALGLTAAISVPAFFALQKTITAGNMFNFDIIAFHHYFYNILGNFIAFTPPTSIDGLPNIYSGMISIMLSSVFLLSRKVSRREKLVFSVTMVILFLSCNLNVMHYAWNAFRYTNQIPFRFTFIISFVLAATAYKSFTITGKFMKQDILSMGIITSIVLLSALAGFQETNYVIASAVLVIIYLLVLSYANGLKTIKQRTVFNFLFLFLILAELSGTAFIAVKSNHTTDRETYPDRYNDIKTLLDRRQAQDTDFYRTEFTSRFTNNDPSLYNYNGISYFSSRANTNSLNFITGLGLPVSEGENGNMYLETSPLANAFLNIRYLISRDGNPADNDVFWKTVERSGDSLLLENKHYLPFGFMVNENLASYSSFENPFLSKNDLFRLATGLEDNLFSIYPQNNFLFIIKEDDEGRFPLFMEWDFDMPYDGMLYAYYKRENVRTLSVSINGDNSYDIDTSAFAVGNFVQGDRISFQSEHGVPMEEGTTMELPELIEQIMSMGAPVIYMASINSELFEQGISILASSPLILTEFSPSRIRGEVTALNDGLLYTSIPTDGNWYAFVNGIETDVILIDGSMLALRLSEGTHHIEFRYKNSLLIYGIFISLASLIILIIIILLNIHKKRSKKNVQE